MELCGQHKCKSRWYLYRPLKIIIQHASFHWSRPLHPTSPFPLTFGLFKFFKLVQTWWSGTHTQTHLAQLVLIVLANAEKSETWNCIFFKKNKTQLNIKMAVKPAQGKKKHVAQVVTKTVTLVYHLSTGYFFLPKLFKAKLKCK